MDWVLKLGGSLYSHPLLPRLLEHVQNLSQSCDRCTIVAGGGPFADQVRLADKRWHLDDATAHRMAILGMRLYGRLLASLSQLPTCYAEAQSDERCIIWLPADDPLPACLVHIPSYQLNWDFTSDSISLCLAQHIGVQYLVLLKAIAVDPAHPFAKLVDKNFSKLMQNTSVVVICLSIEQCLRLNSLAELIRYRIDA